MKGQPKGTGAKEGKSQPAQQITAGSPLKRLYDSLSGDSKQKIEALKPLYCSKKDSEQDANKENSTAKQDTGNKKQIDVELFEISSLFNGTVAPKEIKGGSLIRDVEDLVLACNSKLVTETYKFLESFSYKLKKALAGSRTVGMYYPCYSYA